jgi:hypothetical protein
MIKFEESGYAEKDKIVNIPRYVFAQDSQKTRRLVLEHLDRKGRYKVPEGENSWSDGALGLMGFYIESDVTSRSDFIPYGHLHLDILSLFKRSNVNFIMVYCSPNNRLFIYDRPTGSADFILNK